MAWEWLVSAKVTLILHNNGLFSSVHFNTLLNTRFSEVLGLLEEVAFLVRAEGVLRRWRISTNFLEDWSGNVEASFAEFHCCSRLGQITTFCNTETL